MYSETQLTAIGGRVWKKYGHHHVYFSAPLTTRLYGMLFTTRDMVNIESATLDGKPIDLSLTVKILSNIEYGRVWYDFDDEDFHYHGDFGIFNTIINVIKDIVGEPITKPIPSIPPTETPTTTIHEE